MKRLIIAVALAMSGCAGGISIPPSPVAVAQQTVMDEKAVIAVETAYMLAAKAASIAIRAKVVTNVTTIREIGRLDNQAYLAVTMLRSAYRAGNASSYITAYAEAKNAILAINALL